MIVGLTGGIASGKSTVAALFEALGIAIIDADEMARSVVGPGTQGLATVIERFGQEYLLENGQLNRKRLGEMVFSRPEQRRKLEHLLHPLIKTAMLRKAEQYPTAAYILFVIPLLYETGQNDLVDRVLLVDCSEETQLNRLMARDGVTRQHARSIIDSQASQQQRQQLANDLIRNETEEDREQMVSKVDTLHRMYLRLAARKNH